MSTVFYIELIQKFYLIKFNMLDNKIAVIGLGYVGLPLALAFGEKFRTIGFDINKKRIKDLQNKNDTNILSKKKSYYK